MIVKTRKCDSLFKADGIYSLITGCLILQYVLCFFQWQRAEIIVICRLESGLQLSVVKPKPK